jgi:hypothetical protein
MLGERVMEELRDRVTDVMRQRLGETFRRLGHEQGSLGAGFGNRQEFGRWATSGLRSTWIG